MIGDALLQYRNTVFWRYDCFFLGASRTGTHSGTIYIGKQAGDDLKAIQSMAGELFAGANPLHFEVWPMLRQMEAEIVRDNF